MTNFTSSSTYPSGASADRLLFSSIKPWFAFDKRMLFLLLLGGLLLNNYLFSHYIMKDEVFYRSLGERISEDRIAEFLGVREQYAWLAYAVIPVFMLIRISFTAVCLNIGTLFAGYQVGFGKLWRIALVADSIFLLQAFVRTLVIFLNLDDTTTMIDIGFTNPLSLTSLIGPDSGVMWLAYPLYVANLYEVAYWLILAVGLHWTLQKPFGKMFAQVMVSYGIGLLIWITTVVFLSINYRPE